MLADGELAGAVAYQVRWLVLAVVLLVAVVGWNVGVVLWARPRRARHADEPRPLPIDQLRRDCLAHIDDLVADHRAGQTDDREGHRRLSALVRQFVEAAGGAPATSMTLARLRAEGRDELAGVVDVVTTTYPPTFGPGRPVTTFDDAVVLARRLVGAWQ